MEIVIDDDDDDEGFEFEDNFHGGVGFVDELEDNKNLSQSS